MMNIRQRTVNVQRITLLEKLKANLAIHKKEYDQALKDYHDRLLADLKLAAQTVKATKTKDLKRFSFSLDFPENHTKDYEHIIEMLEESVDETINLDHDSFRAYFKNEWAWQGHFISNSLKYKTIGASMSLD